MSKPPIVISTQLLPSLPLQPPSYQMLSELLKTIPEGSDGEAGLTPGFQHQPHHSLHRPVQPTSLSGSDESSAEPAERFSVVTATATSKKQKKKKKKKTQERKDKKPLSLWQYSYDEVIPTADTAHHDHHINEDENENQEE